MKKLTILLGIIVVLASCTQQTITLVSTTEQEPWETKEVENTTASAETADIIIDRTQTLQTIEGFGGCFNELGWDALSSLSEEDRNSIMSEFFTPETGANFTICRMPVAANDFSMDWYSYDEVEGDFAMDSFNIANDLNTLIPFIKKAKSYYPELKMWASPWSPPAWMKYNKHYACAMPGDWLAVEYRNGLSEDKQGKEGSNMFIQEDAYFKAYALYFSKFISAYKEQGIDIAMVMPQNEWNSCQVFPSCTWTAAGLAEFIGKFLGPEMEKQGVEIMLGTMERPTEELVDTILNDIESGKYIKGVGFQWGGKDAIPGINKRYPDLKLYQTEQECGDGKNDWKHCLHSWDLMKHYISNGTSSYLYWNMALAEGGVSRWGWSQNSLITVNKENKSYRYNHEFYLLKHLSHFVKPGARLLNTSGKNNNLLAFENLDKSIIVITQNEKTTARQLTINLDKKNIIVSLKADSFNTVVIK
ncbi:MAG: beta-glycosidase [Salinivirgaceae bacterium]|jgi:glucosylceramidase|nr:beta-glycosidase [Salinivirgaceae bacterium]